MTLVKLRETVGQKSGEILFHPLPVKLYTELWLIVLKRCANKLLQLFVVSRCVIFEGIITLFLARYKGGHFMPMIALLLVRTINPNSRVLVYGLTHIQNGNYIDWGMQRTLYVNPYCSRNWGGILCPQDIKNPKDFWSVRTQSPHPLCEEG